MTVSARSFAGMGSARAAVPDAPLDFPATIAAFAFLRHIPLTQPLQLGSILRLVTAYGLK